MNYILCLIMILAILGGCSHPKEMSQTEAEKLATTKLEEYIKKEKLSPSQFEKPEVRYVEKDATGQKINMWEIDYVSKDKPFHHVTILVGQYGGVELHRMIDNTGKE